MWEITPSRPKPDFRGYRAGQVHCDPEAGHSAIAEPVFCHQQQDGYLVA
jgi:hypothetical protein